MKTKLQIDFLELYNKEDLIKELHRISEIIDRRPITKKDILKYGRVSYPTIYKKFGGLSKAVKAANLIPNINHNVSDKELIDSLISVWQKTLSEFGRRPERGDLKRYGISYSDDTYYRRFGNWKKALLAAYNSVSDEETQIEEERIKNKPETKQRSPISVRKRFIVFKRDEFTCVICGASGRGVKLEVDHIIPIAKNGSDRMDNLQTLCFDCNRGKRDNYQ